MAEFEREVMEKLGVLEERTKSIPDIVENVADIKGRVKLLEFKAGFFGTVAGILVVIADNFIRGRH